MGNQPRDKAYVHDAHWYPDNNVELILGTRATGLDPKEHTVTLDGPDTVRYDKLRLATGSRVRRLDLPGSDNPGIRYLRTVTESDAILSDLREEALAGELPRRCGELLHEHAVVGIERGQRRRGERRDHSKQDTEYRLRVRTPRAEALEQHVRREPAYVLGDDRLRPGHERF
jgi:hypothetical protein